MELFTAMRKRRMHRAFADEPVPRELLELLVWSAWRSATARAGVRHFLVIDDPRLLKTLRQACPGFINNAPAAIDFDASEASTHLPARVMPTVVIRYRMGSRARRTCAAVTQLTSCSADSPPKRTMTCVR